MKFVVLFEDNSADPGIRQQYMAAHLAFLDSHAGQIEAAGPLTGPTGAPSGGIWILDAADEADVTRLVHEDPFWPTGLRKSFVIHRWKQVFANSVRVLQS